MEIQGKVGYGVKDPYGIAQGAQIDGTGRRQKEVQREATSTGDTVTVSKDALLLTEGRRVAQNAPDVRADKVERLRIEVENGTYKPDSKLIAESLVREEPQLFSLQPSA
ncbi:MAG: flagellar biosynthesis anti-sigma factor FlgM [Desulfovibrio sp.]|jgi:negative regulator of flagellin synthesis FlgM|nr:flagellar biosynthesis anti-sigma factor FlgM [Desulfovibrio sp.]